MKKLIIATIAICITAQVYAGTNGPFVCTAAGRFKSTESAISYYLCIIIRPSAPLQGNSMSCPNALVFNPVTESCTITDNVDMCELLPIYNSATCDTGGVWLDYAPGVQRMAVGTEVFSGCTYSRCFGTVEYRCAPGYYGNPVSTEGCNSCATDTGNPNATSAAGSLSINRCYIPAGATDSDSSGTFEYTSNCNYANYAL